MPRNSNVTILTPSKSKWIIFVAEVDRRCKPFLGGHPAQNVNIHNYHQIEITLKKFEGEPHTFIPQNPTSPASVAALQLITDFIHEQAR